MSFYMRYSFYCSILQMSTYKHIHSQNSSKEMLFNISFSSGRIFRRMGSRHRCSSGRNSINCAKTSPSIGLDLNLVSGG